MERADALLTEENSNDVFYDMVIKQELPLTLKLLFRSREMGGLAIHELLCEVSYYPSSGITALFNTYVPDRIIISSRSNVYDVFLINRQSNMHEARMQRHIADRLYSAVRIWMNTVRAWH